MFVYVSFEFCVLLKKTLVCVCVCVCVCLGPPGGSASKESACNAVDAGDAVSIPGSGRSYEGGHGNPFQYSCLENPMD